MKNKTMAAAKAYVEGLTQYGPMDPVAEGFIEGAEWMAKEIVSDLRANGYVIADEIEKKFNQT